jgi:hypothetical protein
VIARLDPRVTAVGQNARGEVCNRELALERLRRRLTDARSTQSRAPSDAPTVQAVRRRLESKRRQAARQRERQRPRTDE